ncbi:MULTISPECIES: type II secretion system F family protein [unclassified Mesobacillus]|uniref:type II secretion system F family protein n=1 Tax=unclassified Mesobacillus TaxID=2675270 RepID=UPI0020413C56|nr:MULTISPECIES: type II secretion system F family protein [unclassified Mesobacillus]MCM3122586.1 type II secretion system F family protein [Mesobacillus sp. MER 33]MCM3232550.1 type II secretion system F family protein [Mesobacillus sp. MER 48]
MARFKYSGRDRTKKRSGTITAGSKREALEKLRAEGIRTTDIIEVPETLLTKEISFGNPVKLQHLVIFLRQFATLLKAGVSVVESTKILAHQTDSKALRKALLDIEAELREGNQLSQASSRHSKIFSPMYINMIKAGEAGGNMDETLERLADHYEKQHSIRQKIVAALTYPAVIGLIAVGVVIFLLVSVVPTFVGMFEDFGGELPAITMFVLKASEFMQSFWWLLLLFFIGCTVSLVLAKKNKKSKYYLDYAMLRMPIFGKLMQKAVLARMTRTLSSLFTSSVPILQALSIVENVVENEVIARVVRDSRDAMEVGESMTGPMRRHWAFPPLVTQMIAIGEETGSLDGMLGKVADFYEKEVETSTDQLKSLIEPIMIVLLAGLVGTIVTSIMVPMFDIFNHVN